MEMKMAKAQFPTSVAIAQQVSYELDSQLPSKNSRLSGEQNKRDSNVSVISISSRTEQSTPSNKFLNSGKLWTCIQAMQF